MGTKYVIKLKGTDCYLKNTGEKAINFTRDINKAKVFERHFDKKDIIDKLNAGEYKVKRESCKTDFIKLTMDKNTWQDLLNEQTDQIRDLSKSRRTCHQYSFSLIDQFETKAKSYERSGEFPNFNCQFYGEDFEREMLISK